LEGLWLNTGASPFIHGGIMMSINELLDKIKQAAEITSIEPEDIRYDLEKLRGLVNLTIEICADRAAREED
jgi:hypothetical protein